MYLPIITGAFVVKGRSARGLPTLRPSHLSAPRLARLSHVPSSTPPQTEAAVEDSATETDATTATSEASTSDASTLPELQYIKPSDLQGAITSFRLFFALPWRRFKSKSALTFKLSGAIAEQPQSRFSQTTSLPAICDSLQKAAVDPRVVGLVIKIDPLQVGWGKILEIRRHVEMFRASGKFTIAYLERAGEKEYFLASAFEEIYAPPCASLSLRGLSVSGSFLRGVFDKVGVEPQVKRIGKYKSAGDQLLRTDMSEAQREQLGALLDDIYEDFTNGIATARKKTPEEVQELLDSGMYKMEEFLSGGWVDGLMYEDQVNDIVKERTGGKEDELRCVGLRKYAKVGRSAFNLDGGKTIAVVRTSGAISGGTGGNGITAGAVIAQLRALKKNKRIAAVVLRVDSPGGDALASDLMWREIQKLSEEKPVIASMADVAASGGYYMAMACRKIVAEALTITGSIGVVTGKFSLAELYKKAGFNKETISKGKFAELLLETRSFTDQEQELFDASAEYAYESFRNKAASSRGMEIETMQDVAQGRVWSGKRAATIGLVDAVGGLQRAIALAKEEAGIKPEEKVRLLEVSRASVSPLALLTGGGGATAGLGPLRVAASGVLMLQALIGGGGVAGLTPAAAVGAPALMEMLAAVVGAGNVDGGAGEASLFKGLANGAVMAQLPELSIDGVSSKALLQMNVDSGFNGSFGSELFDE